jgi:hypothetical protein
MKKANELQDLTKAQIREFEEVQGLLEKALDKLLTLRGSEMVPGKNISGLHFGIFSDLVDELDEFCAQYNSLMIYGLEIEK